MEVIVTGGYYYPKDELITIGPVREVITDAARSRHCSVHEYAD